MWCARINRHSSSSSSSFLSLLLLWLYFFVIIKPLDQMSFISCPPLEMVNTVHFILPLSCRGPLRFITQMCLLFFISFANLLFANLNLQFFIFAKTTNSFDKFHKIELRNAKQIKRGVILSLLSSICNNVCGSFSTTSIWKQNYCLKVACNWDSVRWPYLCVHMRNSNGVIYWRE